MRPGCSQPIQVIEQDTFDIGVFLKARKPDGWRPVDLRSYHLYRVEGE